ncbi:oxidoreductase [Devosia limi DSM 17137]|uniref:Glycine/D-amino acid oxidase n=1 Tax=Devosia limi DSM 17137 TaxID=1121477 RepID=A0A0F5LCN0_9HYPH|nr:oxidoreductase [Devosia limi DSM 17137]SHF31384.1 Glycine/D-amino acid oxidase [Devosia limi DSM 17137]
MVSTSSLSVIIIGCGIVGASTAYFLARAGVQVEILDAIEPAAQATGSADGAVSVASKRPGPVMNAALAGIALYRELAVQGLFEGAFKSRSTFVLASSPVEREVLEAHAAVLRSVGVRVEMLTSTDLRARFAPLSDAVIMGLEVFDEGHAIGYQIVHRLLSAAPVNVRRNCRVESFLRDGNGRVTGVVTNHGPMLADAVVVASGNGSADLLGIPDVLIARKGQLLVTERAPALNAAMPGAIMSGRYLISKGMQAGTALASDRGYGTVVDPLATGQFLIGGTREDSGEKATNDAEAVAEVLRRAVEMVPGLAGVRLLRAFAGIRTAVIDSKPLIGRVPDADNVYVATGFEGDGICLGPVTGKAISQLVLDRSVDLDLAPFSPARFAQLGVAA